MTKYPGKGKGCEQVHSEEQIIRVDSDRRVVLGAHREGVRLRIYSLGWGFSGEPTAKAVHVQ